MLKANEPLKAGTELIEKLYTSSNTYYDTVTVARVLKSKIVTTNGREYSREGKPLSTYDRRELFPATPETRQEMQDANDRFAALAMINNTKFQHVSVARLRQIQQIITEDIQEKNAREEAFLASLPN